MIVKKSKRWIRFLRTTAIGGLLFLLPLIVLGALASQLAPIVITIRDFIRNNSDEIPVHTPTGIAFLTCLSIVILLLLCFAAGLIAKWSIGQRVSGLFEKNLLLLFPRYAILKDQMADTIGGHDNRPQMKSVLVRLNDQRLIGFETERSADGNQVAVYLPGSPDTWAGYVAIVDADRVDPLEMTFGDTVANCEQLGRGCFERMKKGVVGSGKKAVGQ